MDRAESRMVAATPGWLPAWAFLALMIGLPFAAANCLVAERSAGPLAKDRLCPDCRARAGPGPSNRACEGAIHAYPQPGPKR